MGSRVCPLHIIPDRTKQVSFPGGTEVVAFDWLTKHSLPPEEPIALLDPPFDAALIRRLKSSDSQCGSTEALNRSEKLKTDLQSDIKNNSLDLTSIQFK